MSQVDSLTWRSPDGRPHPCFRRSPMAVPHVYGPPNLDPLLLSLSSLWSSSSTPTTYLVPRTRCLNDGSSCFKGTRRLPPPATEAPPGFVLPAIEVAVLQVATTRCRIQRWRARPVLVREIEVRKGSRGASDRGDSSELPMVRGLQGECEGGACWRRRWWW